MIEFSKEINNLYWNVEYYVYYWIVYLDILIVEFMLYFGFVCIIVIIYVKLIYLVLKLNF